MSVRINLEIGHEASIRTKRTQEGFTHDWEVFVRGCEHANIQHYVEKVVFYLHETFPKPKRVIKDPPYSVKESGYAGFTLPIEIHLRNKDEPKKICFNYDLNLQQTGPAIIKVQKEKYVFNSLGEDFKSKLLKGGGIVVNSSGSQELVRESRPASEEKSQLVSKPRLGGSDFVKKHKPKLEEPRVSNSFQDLFGPPITKTSKTSFDAKPISKDKNSNINKSSSGDKEKSKTKHSPHKDKEKDKDKEKFREKDSEKKSKDDKKREEKKEHSKDREERIKEKKERREKSPKVRSPTPTKKPSSPKRPPSPLPKYKDKEEKKIETPKEKKIPEIKDKSEKKAKKEKREKDKERKESKHKDKDNQKSAEQKENKNASREKDKHKESISVRDKEPSPLPPKTEKKDKPVKEKEIIKDYIKETKEIEHIDKNGKFKNDKLDEKPKHKHKKKDKDKKEKEKQNEKEKTHKSEKKSDKSVVSTGSKYIEINKDAPKENEKISLFNSPKNNLIESKTSEKPKKPLNRLLAQFDDNDTSNSSISSQEDFNELPIKPEPKKEPSFEPQPPPKPEPPPEKLKSKKEKTKKNKDKKAEKDNEKKRKRKSETNRVEEPLEKIPKEESSNSNSKDSDTEQTSAQMDVQTENEENYEDYMNILRDLQRKILTLQDNAELQKVVQLIAETGRFEVSAQTFDFDLCLLERSTIKQLQNFFESTS